LDAFQEEERRIAPLLQTNINDKVFQSMRSGRTTPYNSMDPVVIMNPFDDENEEVYKLRDQESSLMETSGQTTLINQPPTVTSNPSYGIYSNLKVAFMSKPDPK